MISIIVWKVVIDKNFGNIHFKCLFKKEDKKSREVQGRATLSTGRMLLIREEWKNKMTQKFASYFSRTFLISSLNKKNRDSLFIRYK